MKKHLQLFACLGVLSILLASCTTGVGGNNEPQELEWGIPTYTWAVDYSTCTAERICLNDNNQKETETVNSTYEILTDAKCDKDGLGRYTASFSNIAFNIQMHDEAIEAIGHNYQFDSFVWTGFTAQAKLVCTHDFEHIKFCDADVISEITKYPTCETNGMRTYTAFYEGYTDTVTEIINATGHNWGVPTYTWANDYSTCTAERLCLTDSSHKETETVNSSYAVTTSATYDADGEGTYTAIFNNPGFETQTMSVKIDQLVRYYGQFPVLSSDGKNITYGLYPQTNVNDIELIAALNELTTTESNGWYLYNGEYYAKVIATPHSSDYTFDNGTTILRRVTYWFKCEPIVWNILSNNNDEYYILSSILLDAHIYNSYWTGTDENGRYANNYEYSEIRSWLNNDFYNSAFALGNSNIQTTTVDNSAATTNDDANPYVCNNTEDKVFLPSYKDYTNINYFFYYWGKPTERAETRFCKTTDWALARGAYIFSGYETGSYFSRSPSNTHSYGVMGVYWGSVNSYYVSEKEFGVRPALTIKIV